MGYAAPLFNAVLTVIQDACQGPPKSGPIQTIKDLQPQAVYILALPASNVGTPCILVRLPEEPYSQSSWGGSSDLRNGLFIVDVDLVDQVKINDHPMGDENLSGILTLADDLMDLLETEASRGKFREATPKLVDYEVTTTAHTRGGSNGLMVAATVRLAFKTRFRAGNR